jgi:hypothetical protein
MKIRSGFVSNSSSSSFVMIGVYTNDETSIPGLRSLYLDDSDYTYAKGIVLADDEYMEYVNISIDKVQEHAKTVSEKLGIDISEVKLIAGTRPC